MHSKCINIHDREHTQSMLSEGRMAEAMTEAKLALQSDPLSSYAHAIYGFICGYAG